MAAPSAITRLLRPALAMLAVAALAAGGCTRTPLFSQEPSPQQGQPLEALVAAPQGASWTALTPQGALLHLPDGRQVARGLRERRQGQGLVQEIEIPVDGGTGRNLLTVAVHGQAAQPTLYPGKPSQDGIRTEIAAAFPGRTFRVLAEPRRNAFGPYGLAVFAGRDGERCVYAWQWLDRDDRRVVAALGGSASWRARICRKGESLDTIATALDAIAIGARTGLAADPAGEPLLLVPSPTRARPVAASRPAPRIASRDRAVAPPVMTRPAPSRPNLAQPGPSLSGPAQGGQRYLATLTDDPRLPDGPSVRTTLDQSLPSEAYRGPVGRAVPAPRYAPRQAQAGPIGLVPSPD